MINNSETLNKETVNNTISKIIKGKNKKKHIGFIAAVARGRIFIMLNAPHKYLLRCNFIKWTGRYKLRNLDETHTLNRDYDSTIIYVCMYVCM